jgi:hypothetical protein
VACNKYLNQFYAYSWVYVHCYLNYAKYVFVNALKSMAYVFLSICSVWKIRWSSCTNQIFRFSWPNRMFQFAKLDCSILADITYISLALFVWTSCHMHHILLVYTHFCCTPCMHTYRGALLDFSWKICKMAFYAKIEFHSICTYLGELTLYVWIQNAYWISFISSNQELPSIIKRGLKVHLAP